MEKLAAFALAALLLAPQAVDEAARAAQARDLTRWDRTTESVTAIYAIATPEVKAVIDGTGGPPALAQAFAGPLGAEGKVFRESVITLNGVTTYQRLSAWEKFPAALTVIGIDAKGAVSGFAVRPSVAPVSAANDPIVQTKLAAPLARPRQGDWSVAWGGLDTAVNYHVAVPEQRYAYDLWVVKEGRTFQGDAQANESYFCFGEPILSPAPGKVVGAVDGVRDNVPVGAMNAAQLTGNHVIIEHRTGEFSMLAHLKNGSVAVKEGDEVKAGDRLGLCGNSGNTSEPHLHFQMQNAKVFTRGIQALPATFQSLEVDGRRVQNAVPLRGQRIAP